MSAALPAVSFILVVLLGLLLILPAIRRDTVRICLISWLVLSNLIHVINTVAWSSNTNIHVPVWCDITTKVLLGTMVALPGALLCLASKLEFLASQRPILFASNPSTGGEPAENANLTAKRLRVAKIKQWIFDLSLCVVFPVVFLFLQFIVQNHRFDITADLGCSASIHPSTPGLIITSLPPLLLCIATLIVAGQAIHNSFLLPHSGFSQHIISRSEQNPFTETMSSSFFLRRMILILILTAIMTVFTLFAAFTRSTVAAFSWQIVHADMGEIHIVKGGDELRYTILTWWEIPVVSIVYVLLEVSVGQEVRDGVRGAVENGKKVYMDWQSKRMEKKAEAAKENVLPLHRSSSQAEVVHIQVPLSAIDSRNASQDKGYVSGWDDMMDLKSSPKSYKSKSPTPTDSSSSSPSASPTRKPPSLRADSPRRSVSAASRTSRLSRADGSSSPVSARFVWPGSSVSPKKITSYTEDEAFTASTLEYLNSPTAQSLGLQSPPSPSPLSTLVNPVSPSPSSPSPVRIMSPPAVYASPSKTGYDRTEPPWRSNGRVTPISRAVDNASPTSSPSPSSQVFPSTSRTQTPTVPRRNADIDAKPRLEDTLLTSNRFFERKAVQKVPDDVESVISSIIEVPWPQPPTSLPISRLAGYPSRPDSPASSDSSCVIASAYPLEDAVRPFRGHSITPVSDVDQRPVSPLNLPKKKRSGGILKQHLQRNLNLGSTTKAHYGLPPGDAIYMSVVQERI